MTRRLQIPLSMTIARRLCSEIFHTVSFTVRIALVSLSHTHTHTHTLKWGVGVSTAVRRRLGLRNARLRGAS